MVPLAFFGALLIERRSVSDARHPVAENVQVHPTTHCTTVSHSDEEKDMCRNAFLDF